MKFKLEVSGGDPSNGPEYEKKLKDLGFDFINCVLTVEKEFSTIDDLLAFRDFIGQPLIIDRCGATGNFTIEIYDGYRE